VQADGFVISPKSWREDFLHWDYLGAPWNLSTNSYIDPFGNQQRVGNGGFSLRSHRLLTTPLRQNIVWEVNNNNFFKHMNHGLYSEDGIICIHNRHKYIEDGCKFAPIEVALNFSVEQPVPEFSNQKTFGFHKKIPDLCLRVKLEIRFLIFKYGLR
jgi:hypothetical protein